MAGQWLSKPGADVEFLATDPKDAAKLEAAFRKNPKDQALVGRYRFKGETPEAQAQPDFVGRLKQWFTQQPSPESLQGKLEGASTGLAALGTGQRMLANAILPGTNTGAAVDLAAGAMPAIAPIRAGMKALPAIGRVAARIGVPTAVGAAMGGIQGGSEGAVEGAKLGGVAGTVGEVAGAIPAGIAGFYKRFGHLNTQSFQSAVRNKLGPKLAQAVAEDIPSLGKSMTLNSTRDLDLITEPEGGQKVIGKMFDTIEGKIVQSLGANKLKIDVPAGALMATGRMKVTPGSTASGIAPNTMIPLNPAEAIRINKELRAQAFRGVQDATGQPLRELSDQTTQALMDAIQKADPKLAGQYTQLRSDYGKFVDLKDFMKGQNTNLLPTMPEGAPTVNLPKVYDSLRDSNIDRNRFSNLYDFFEGGTQGGPVTSRTATKERLHLLGTTTPVTLPGAVKLSRPLEEALGPVGSIGKTIEKVGKSAGAVRAAGTISSVPTIEQMLMDQQSSMNEPLPSQLMSRQPLEQPAQP